MKTSPLLRPLPGRWRWLALVIALVAVVACNIWYTNRVQHQAEQRSAAQQREIGRAWCIFLVPIGDRQKANPSTKPDDILVAQAVAALRAAYHC